MITLAEIRTAKTSVLLRLMLDDGYAEALVKAARDCGVTLGQIKQLFEMIDLEIDRRIPVPAPGRDL